MRRSLFTVMAASLLSACVATDGDKSSSSAASSSATVVSSSSKSASSVSVASSSLVPSSSAVASSSSAAGLSFPVGNATQGKIEYETQGGGRNCVTCHGTKGNNGLVSVVLDPTKTAWVRGTNSPVSLEEYIYRYMPSETVPGQCNEQCSADIAAYIRTWATGSSASSSSAAPLSFKGVVCDDRVTYAARQLKLLTRQEYQNSVEDLLGITYETAKNLPDDSHIHGYANNIAANVTEVHVDSYLVAAEAIAAQSRAKGFIGVTTCATAASASACADEIINGFGKRAFRRPLNDQESVAIHDLFAEAYLDGDLKNGVEMAITAILSSPGFLYRSEQGIPIATNEFDGMQYAFADGVGTSLKATDFTDIRQQSAGTIAGALIIGDTSNGQIGKLGKHISFPGQTLIRARLRGVLPADGTIPTLRVYTSGYSLEMKINWSEFREVSFYFPALASHTELAFEKYSDTSRIEIAGITYGKGVLIPNAPDLDAYELTPYEVATYLAYTFTGSTPDAQLLAAADTNSLKTEEQIAAQVQRLLASPRAKTHLGDFVEQWLGVDGALSAAKDPAKYPELTEPVRKAMVQEVRELFAHVVLDSSQNITDFYAANYTFANKTLADYYGLTGATGDSFVKINAGNRGGILTTGAFMTTYGNNDESSPIRRARAVRERLLCQDIPPPPAGVVVDREAAAKELAARWETGQMSNRERYHLLTLGETCQACHKEVINPLGFGMEDFDTIGRYQALDRNGLAVDATGTLYGVGSLGDGQALSFNGARDLSHKLANIDSAKVCFAENFFRYALGTGSDKIDEDNVDLGALSEQEQLDYACSVQDTAAALVSADNDPKVLLEHLGALKLVRYRKELNR